MQPLRTLSYLALDAPLVAGTWWLLFEGAFPSPGGRWHIPAALVSAVWFIYLLDRIWDENGSPDGPVPERKEFIRSHPFMIRSLLLFAFILAVGFGARLGGVLLFQVGVIGVCTILYFALCRWHRVITPMPAKEILIGLCFAASVGLPFDLETSFLEVGGLFVLGMLCTLNCLMISKIERSYDRESDVCAWFAQPKRTFPILRCLALAGGVAIVLSAVGLPHVVGAALLGSTVCLAVLDRMGSLRRSKGMMPGLIDAALWAPALPGLFV